MRIICFLSLSYNMGKGYKLMKSPLVYMFLILLKISESEGKVFMLGVLFPWGGWFACGEHGCGGAVLVAVDEINSDPVRFPTFHSQGHQLAITYADSGCDAAVGLPYMPEMYFAHGFPPIDAYIGPACSVICEPGGHMAKKWKIPMVSFICTSTILSDKTLYPTFARTAAPSLTVAPFFGQMMKEFGFERAAIFYSSQNIQVLTAIAIKEEFLRIGVLVTDFVIFEPGPLGKLQEHRALQQASRRSRGEMFSLYVFIIFVLVTIHRIML